DEHPLSWCRIIGDKGINWTSDAPFGVGTTRTVSALKGANKFREYFFVWEEGRRQSFYVLEASAPLVKRFAEDYVVEPTSDTSCSFTWTIAYEPSAIGKPGDALNKRLLKSLFADTRKHYAS
ncbi:MAG: SRPBCC family protein, partial [Solirubrobacterales bacterium]